MTRYCICRSKDSSSFMIACERCEEWFHGKCVGITKKRANNIDQYYCPECKKNNPSLNVTYKTPCPVPEKKTETIKQEPFEELKQVKKIVEKGQSTSASTKPTKPKTKPVISTPSKLSQSKRKVGGQRVKSKSHKDRKQCANLDCIFEARQDSKYCSQECGYNFNKLMYETHFIPKWEVLEKNHSQARLQKMKDLDQLERDKIEVEQRIKNLKDEKEELEQNIKIIKDQAKKLCKDNADLKENDDDDAEEDNDDVEEIISGDLTKTFCITCGHTILSHQAFKHWASCHKKHEAVYNFTADVLVNYTCKEDENPKLYCHHQDKKTKRYCMHIESACPQHSNWHSDKDEVCGCPLNVMQKLVPDGNYCLELKRDCTQHYHWDKFRLAQMNMERVQAFNLREALIERIRIAAVNLNDTYGGVLGVMLHNTINHSSKKETPESATPSDNEDVVVEMEVDEQSRSS